MNRAVTSVVLLLTFLAFVMIGGASGMYSSGDQMGHARGATALSKNQQDRCQMAALCLAHCVQCSVGMRAETAASAGTTSIKADLHRRLAKRTVSERLYRPPRVGPSH